MIRALLAGLVVAVFIGGGFLIGVMLSVVRDPWGWFKFAFVPIVFFAIAIVAMVMDTRKNLRRRKAGWR